MKINNTVTKVYQKTTAPKTTPADAVLGGVASTLKPGEKVVIKDGDQPPVVIEKHGPADTSGIGRVFEGMGNLASVGLNEARIFAKNDPGLAFRTVADKFRDGLKSTVDSSERNSVDQVYVPLVRLGSACISTWKSYHNWNNPTVSNLQKGVDALHVATDLIGLAGVVGGLFSNSMPSVLSANSNLLLQIAWAGDITSSTLSTLSYGKDMVSRLNAAREAKGKEAPKS